MVKNIYKAAALFVALAGFWSCSVKENTFPDTVPNGNVPLSVLKASFANGRPFPSDASISVWRPVHAGERFSMLSPGGGAEAEFRFEDSGKEKQIAYALYPDVEIDSLYRGVFYAKIKSEQTAVEGGFDESLFLSTGHIRNGETVLKTVVGTLRFKINQPDIASCTIATPDNAVAGAVKIVMNDTIAVSPLSAATGRVTVEGKLEQGKEYGAVVMADTYGKVTVTLRNQFGITVWEEDMTVCGDGVVPCGGSAELGLVGEPGISTLEISFDSEQYDGYKVKRIIGYAADSGKKLFGSDVGKTLVRGQGMKVKFYGVRPTDHSSTQIWYVFTMEKGNDRVVLPICEPGFNVPDHSDLTKDLGILASSRNAAPWYYPYEDMRVMSGAGFAYGDANTYLIQYKGGSYCGTFDPDPSIPESVTIDYRLRGELFKSAIPEGVTFRFMTGPDGSVYTMNRSKITNCGNYTISVDEAAYKVTVTNTGAHAGSPILLMEKDGEVVWAWTFWNIAADGTRLEAVDFGSTGVKLANMDIGHPSTQKDSLMKYLGQLRYASNYYQWGRPIPTFSGSGAGAYFGDADERNATNAQLPVCDLGKVTVAQALRHPGWLLQNPYSKGKASDNLEDWCADGILNNTDLWGGGKDKNAVYSKSIYDPCPKGWRVPDAKTYFSEFPKGTAPGYDITLYPQERTPGYKGVYIGGVLFPACGFIADNTGSDTYVAQTGYAHSENATCAGSALFWTNTYQDNTSFYALRTDYQFIRYDDASENESREIKVEAKPAGYALSVRCQRDEENR